MFKRYPDSPNPLAEAAVVLVDEIDLHMRPRWQRQVIDHFSRFCPATQFLFGLESAGPPQIETRLEEPRALLAKPKLMSRDRRRLDELEAQIGDLPAGQSAEDRRAMELIRRAAEKLQSSA